MQPAQMQSSKHDVKQILDRGSFWAHQPFLALVSSTINCTFLSSGVAAKIVSEYDQEIPRSQTADKPMEPRGRATQQSINTSKTKKKQSNQLSLPHQDDCKTRMDIK